MAMASTGSVKRVMQCGWRGDAGGVNIGDFLVDFLAASASSAAASSARTAAAAAA
jgi:hypothetical protein